MKRTHFKTLTELPCDPALECTYPNCNCTPVEKVYETNEMPDDKETTVGVFVGFFFGLLLQLVIVGICFLWYFAKEIDTVGQYIIIGFILIAVSLFAWKRFKNMIKP